MDESEELLDRSYEKLDSAELLLDNGFYADCVNRAYYAMFYAARSLLALKEIYPKTHSGVIKKLGLEFVTTGYLDKVAVRAIANAKEDREDADYGIFVGISREEAEDILNDASNFVEKVVKAEELLGKNSKKRIDIPLQPPPIPKKKLIYALGL